ncbi:response regulator [Planctomycetota bacterium]|nr:response regulator [Planctomycetota bacterium]
MATILIVDDQKTDREILGRIVTSLGHEVLFAHDGESAVIKAHAHHPAMILMDVVMPMMDGFNACRRLKKDPATTAIKIVLVTQKGTESDKFWGRKQGADQHVVKPYSAEQIQQVIKEQLG